MTIKNLIDATHSNLIAEVVYVVGKSGGNLTKTDVLKLLEKKLVGIDIASLSWELGRSQEYLEPYSKVGYGNWILSSKGWKLYEELISFCEFTQSSSKRIQHFNQQPLHSGELRALIIGVSSYEDDNIPSLPCTKNDANLMFKTLLKWQCVSQDNIRLLSEDNIVPTKENIDESLMWLFSNASIDDTILIYFSGHSDTVNDSLYLLPSNANSSYYNLTAINVKEKISIVFERNYERETRPGVLILDSCKSGIAKGGASQSLVMIDSTNISNVIGYAFLCACSPTEFAYEDKDLNCGIFTNALVGTINKLFESGCNSIELRALFDESKNNVLKNILLKNKTQTPVINTTAIDKDFIFLQKRDSK